MSCTLSLYIDNSNVVELQTLTNSVTGVVDESATVTVTLKDSAGNNVTGHTWPASMAHASAGTYRVTLDEDVAILVGRQYTAEVNATGSGGEIGKWECCAVAETRKCS